MKRGLQTTLTVLRIGLGVGLLFYLGFSGAIEWSALLRLAKAWPLALVGFALVLTAVILMAERLRLMLRPAGFHLTSTASIRLALIGIFFNTCLPGAAGGDVVKIYYATKGNRGRRTEVATVILLDRLIGLLAMLVWPLLAAPFFASMLADLPVLRGLLWAAAAGAAALVVGGGIGTTPRVKDSRLVTWLFDTIPMGRYAKNIVETVHGYRRHGRTLLAALGLSLVVHTLVFGATLLAAVAINAGAVAWQMTLLMPLGFLANVLPLTPGGLGVGEAAFDTLFGLAGLSGGAETMLGWRLLMVLVGLIGLVFYLQGRQRFIYGTRSSDDAREALLAREEPG